jgi:hypothetical protein
MSLFDVSKHIIGVVFHDHVLYVHVVIAHHHGHFGSEGIVLEVVASFVWLLKWASYDFFSITGLLQGSLVEFNQVSGSLAFLSKVVWTTTFVAFTNFDFPFSLTFGFILLILTVAFAILELTKFLWMVVRPINLLFTLYILHYSEPLAEDRIQRNVGDDFLK